MPLEYVLLLNIQKQNPLFGKSTSTFPTLSSKRARLLDRSVSAWVCPLFFKRTGYTLAAKYSSLVNWFVRAAVDSRFFDGLTVYLHSFDLL